MNPNANIRVVLTPTGTITKRIQKAVHKGLVEAAWFLFERSQELVPVDTSALKRTGRVRELAIDSVDVAYGGPSDVMTSKGTDFVDYALIVHEDLEADHEPGKTAKFLERPARENKKEMADIVLKVSRRGMKYRTRKNA